MRWILFDFDGTIADTKKGIVSGCEYAFSKSNMKGHQRETIIKNIGPPLKEMFTNMVPQASEDTITKLCHDYREYYSTIGLFELDFYEGIIEVLIKLSSSYKLGILSSKPTSFIESILEKYEIPLFSSINGVTLELNNKKKTERLGDFLKRNNLDPRDCIVIGDRAEDCKSAADNHTGFIGVLYGYGSPSEFGKEPTVSSPLFIPDAIETIFKDNQSF